MATEELEKLLTAEKGELETESKQLSEEIDAKQKRFQEIQERLGHVNGLLGDTGESVEEPESSAFASFRDTRDIAEEILRGLGGKELHYRELAERVTARGGVLNGIDPGNTLNARLSKDPRFVRPTRKGFYALRKDYPDAVSVGARASSPSHHSSASR